MRGVVTSKKVMQLTSSLYFTHTPRYITYLFNGHKVLHQILHLLRQYVISDGIASEIANYM